MLYLQPVGGLCNRMRTMESTINLCKQYGKDLTVFWVQDASLNSSFHRLFTLQQDADISINILDCPIGYPINFLGKSTILHRHGKEFNSMKWIALRRIKNLLKGRIISGELSRHLEILEKIPPEHILTNHELSVDYSSGHAQNYKNIRELDALFLARVSSKLKPLLTKSSDAAYLSSCYRIAPLKGNYQLFEPIAQIKNKIIESTRLFHKKTIGIHIRRTDHLAAKSHSTLDKFVSLIERTLEADSEVNFFLSTDDGETKNNLIEKYGSKFLYNNVKSYNRNNQEAVLNAVLDLYCLSRTSKIFGSHQSSFSQTAADIGGINAITVR